MVKPRDEVVRDELKNEADNKLCSTLEAMARTFAFVLFVTQNQWRDLRRDLSPQELDIFTRQFKNVY